MKRIKIEIKICPVCGGKGYIGLNGKFIHGEYLGGEMKTSLKAFVSKNDYSYIINEKGNAMRATLERFGSCTPQLYLQGWLDALSEKRKQEISEECDKSKDIVD